MEMKNLQIVIDLKDLYPEYSSGSYGEPGYYTGDVNDTIKEEIQRQVLDKMIKGFSPEVVKSLKEEMIKKFGAQFDEKISTRIIRVIEHGIFSEKKGTFNINDYVKQKFELHTMNSNFVSALDKVIKNKMDLMQKTLQDRYDMEFASMIIKNLKEGGLLKEGAEKMLLKNE